MDFKDAIRSIAQKVENLKANLKNEEATKMALIVPFIQALGYDVFDPTEVEPECVADIFKKGEKVDYAIHKNGEQQLLIECKHWEENLDHHDSQLRRYYNISPARFGLLTNGIIYKFYADLSKANVLDDKPFLEFDITTIKDVQIEELKKFHKSYYDKDSILNTASELKYMNELKSVIQKQFTNPTSDFVRVLVSEIWDGRYTQGIAEQFTPLVKRSISYYINDMINERLKTALSNSEEKEESKDESVEENKTIEPESKIVTTDEELESFRIVRAIARQIIPINRVYYRDNQSYFNILLDDYSRKPICRMYFNTSNHYIGIFSKDKEETKYKIESLDEIYNYSDKILETIKNYDTE